MVFWGWGQTDLKKKSLPSETKKLSDSLSHFRARVSPFASFPFRVLLELLRILKTPWQFCLLAPGGAGALPSPLHSDLPIPPPGSFLPDGVPVTT